MKKQVWLGLAATLTAGAAASPGAIAQVQSPPPISMATPPVLALPGDHLLLCAINLAPGDLPQEMISINFTAIKISYTSETGSPPVVLGSADITLPPLDSGVLHPPNPCIEIVVEVRARSAPPAPPALVAGLLRLNPQPPRPDPAIVPRQVPLGCRLDIDQQARASVPLAASLQIVTPGAEGEPTNIRLVSFHPPQPC